MYEVSRVIKRLGTERFQQLGGKGGMGSYWSMGKKFCSVRLEKFGLYNNINTLNTTEMYT